MSRRCVHHAKGTIVHVVRAETPDTAECGVRMHTNQAGAAVLINPSHRLPADLRWCPRCIGHVADQAGLLPDLVARLL